jgi:hypothetical protein
MARRTPAPVSTAVDTLDPARVERLRRLAVLLDDSIPIPATGQIALYILLQAARMGVPRSLLARMGWNLAVDVVVGAVPVLGDLFDAGFKANMRNLALLERHVDRPLASTRSSRRFVALLTVLVTLCVIGAVVVLVWLAHLLLTRPVL